MKKISKGITIFGWLLIILNGLFFPSLFDFSAYFQLYSAFPKSIAILFIVYTFLSVTIGIICGVGILRLREWARKIGICINSTDLLLGIPIFILSIRSIRGYISAQVTAEIIKTSPSVDPQILVDFVFAVGSLTIMLFFILSGSFILFFTRQSIKEQFAK